ncbi:MAG: PfkB family carbohydrate kinase, partial [Nocardioidaceae bacterium]
AGLLACAAAASDAGARVALDLASATMIERYGASRFTRLWRSMDPDVVFATDAEWRCAPAPAQPPPTLVLKHGPRGASFITDGTADDRAPLPGEVVDATGAGDALAAGFLLGGADLAMQSAAECLGRVGAHPGGPR